MNCWDDSRLTLRRRAQAAAGASVIQVNSTQLARPAGRCSLRSMLSETLVDSALSLVCRRSIVETTTPLA